MLKRSRSFEAETFDMTPIIDMVFLLIIFFMLVSQFIATEQLKVNVPDQIQAAQEQPEETPPLLITVVPNESGRPMCMVGPQRLTLTESKEMALLVETAVNEALAQRSDAGTTVRLRCDQSIPFGKVKYILAGISKSRAETLQWAVLSE